jgi:(2Fe-2S) ferredoxin
MVFCVGVAMAKKRKWYRPDQSETVKKFVDKHFDGCVGDACKAEQPKDKTR